MTWSWVSALVNLSSGTILALWASVSTFTSVNWFDKLIRKKTVRNTHWFQMLGVKCYFLLLPAKITTQSNCLDDKMIFGVGCIVVKTKHLLLKDKPMYLFCILFMHSYMVSCIWLFAFSIDFACCHLKLLSQALNVEASIFPYGKQTKPRKR